MGLSRNTGILGSSLPFSRYSMRIKAWERPTAKRGSASRLPIGRLRTARASSSSGFPGWCGFRGGFRSRIRPPPARIPKSVSPSAPGPAENGDLDPAPIQLDGGGSEDVPARGKARHRAGRIEPLAEPDGLHKGQGFSASFIEQGQGGPVPGKPLSVGVGGLLLRRWAASGRIRKGPRPGRAKTGPRNPS